jgi:hypothetical protein
VRQARREGFGGPLGMRQMDALYGRREPRPSQEPFEVRARRLHRQGMRSENIAAMLRVELAAVLEALRQDVSA